MTDFIEDCLPLLRKYNTEGGLDIDEDDSELLVQLRDMNLIFLGIKFSKKKNLKLYAVTTKPGVALLNMFKR